MEKLLYATKAALFIEHSPTWIKPARYGLPWAKAELRQCFSLFATQTSLSDMVKQMRRPASGIVAKLEAGGFLQRNSAENEYYIKPFSGFKGYEAAMQRYNAYALAADSPINSGSVANVRDYSLRLESSLYRECTLSTTNTNIVKYVKENALTFSNGVTMPNISVIVDSAVPVQTIDVVFGKDAKTMTDSDFLAAIRKLEDQIADLGKIKSSSTKIKDTIKQLTEDLTKVIALYDAS